ncbi:MAG: hypothetical protein L3K14_04840 [Thermoplasmata archaeon]|nr:hypothetical protein [Thermoplasmata archaeon]
MAEVGEELVGAYLTEVLGCDHALYNVRSPGGGVRGLDELDVVGLDFRHKKAYLCEVSTHLQGYRLKSPRAAVDRVRKKHNRQKRYAEEQLAAFPVREFMFWSPRVSVGVVTRGLEEIEGLQLIINGEYTSRMNELRKKAAHDVRPTSNSAFRLLQILENLRE